MRKQGLSNGVMRLFHITNDNGVFTLDALSIPSTFTDLTALYETLCDESEMLQRENMPSPQSIELLFRCECDDEIPTIPKPIALMYTPENGKYITVLAETRDNARSALRWAEKKEQPAIQLLLNKF